MGGRGDDWEVEDPGVREEAWNAYKKKMEAEAEGERREEGRGLLVQPVDDRHQSRNVPHVLQGDRSLRITLV